MKVSFEGPGEVSLMVYDNNTCVVESFLDEEVKLKIILDPKFTQIENVGNAEKIDGTLREALSFRNRKFGKDVMVFKITLKPHSFKAFKF